MRTVRTADLVVVGWSESRGARGGLGAVHVARPAHGDLVYTGSVGSGFTDAALAETLSMLTNLEIDACPCTGGPIPRGKEHPWVTPRLAAEVGYKELTGQGLLRQPSFGRFRDDKTAEPCEEEPLALPPGEEPEPLEIVETRDVAFTNLDKVFWSEDGYTKGDPIEYHRAVAPWMLTYLRDRPLVMTRYPDGIHGKSFFQKDAPPYAPEWVRAVTVWSEGSERELSCLVAEDVESLLYVIKLGTIPHHVWSSRVVSLAAPDWCVLDLDPKEAPFTDVIEIALLIRDLCDEIGLPSFPKTSVSSGIHVLVPLGGRLTYEQSRTLGQLLGRVVVQERPDVATLTRSPERREGKVYVDFVQNGHGRLVAAPYTVRPRAGAPVSTPLLWEEVTRALRIEDHTIATVLARMAQLGEDPLRPVLDLEPDLLGALQRLSVRFT